MLSGTLLASCLILAFSPTRLCSQAPGTTPRADSLAREAARGDRNAQYEYGHLFETGSEGVPLDYREAVDWYRRAAEQDHVDAMLHMSTMLFMPAPAEAMRWVLRAAELGSAEAQWRSGQVLLARVFLPGVTPDSAAALSWLERAVQQGHHGAEATLADVYTGSRDPARYQEAVGLYERAATSGGDAWSVLRMGMIYAIGEGVPQNDAAAYEWLARLGRQASLNPDYFTKEDLEFLGGLQAYYGLDFNGEAAEEDLELAAEAFRLALGSPAKLIHQSFARTAEGMLRKMEN